MGKFLVEKHLVENKKNERKFVALLKKIGSNDLAMELEDFLGIGQYLRCQYFCTVFWICPLYSNFIRLLGAGHCNITNAKLNWIHTFNRIFRIIYKPQFFFFCWVLWIPYLDQSMGKFVNLSFKKNSLCCFEVVSLSFCFSRNKKNLQLRNCPYLSIKSFMPLMMLPVTSSAEFEQFFSVVFTAKCVENMSVKKYKVYSCL